MTLQTFQHPIETSYNADERAHYMRGFLISTRQTERTQTNPVDGFSISKETGHEKVKTFLGKSFAIIPEALTDPVGKRDGHYYGASRDELVQGYDRHAHGKIKGLFGPFYYPDNSGDYWYDFNIKLFNSQSAAALVELGNGPHVEIPYAVSPHLVWLDDTNENWEGVGVALVRRGAYGPDAVISKLCNGTEHQCTKSFNSAGGHIHELKTECTCCAKSDEIIAKMLTSHKESAGSLSQTMSNNPTYQNTGTTATSYTMPEIKETPIPQPEVKVDVPIVEKSPENKTMTIEEYNELMKIKTEKEQKDKILEELQNEYKTNILNQIFTPQTVKDDAQRKILFDRYFQTKDIKLVRDLFNDFNTHIVPSIKESVKAELEAKTETKTEEVKDTKKQSAGSSQVRPEPKVEEQKDSAGSQKVNEAKLIRDMMFGGTI